MTASEVLFYNNLKKDISKCLFSKSFHFGSKDLHTEGRSVDSNSFTFSKCEYIRKLGIPRTHSYVRTTIFFITGGSYTCIMYLESIVLCCNSLKTLKMCIWSLLFEFVPVLQLQTTVVKVFMKFKVSCKF